jgi:hypothetical protein
MPTWLLDIYVEMYSQLHAEETMGLISMAQATNNITMKDSDRKAFLRQLELRVNRGKLGEMKRPTSHQDIADKGFGTVVLEDGEGVSSGGVVLPRNTHVEIDPSEYM